MQIIEIMRQGYPLLFLKELMARLRNPEIALGMDICSIDPKGKHGAGLLRREQLLEILHF